MKKKAKKVIIKTLKVMFTAIALISFVVCIAMGVWLFLAGGELHGMEALVCGLTTCVSSFVWATSFILGLCLQGFRRS